MLYISNNGTKWQTCSIEWFCLTKMVFQTICFMNRSLSFKYCLCEIAHLRPKFKRKVRVIDTGEAWPKYTFVNHSCVKFD